MFEEFHLWMISLWRLLELEPFFLTTRSRNICWFSDGFPAKENEKLVDVPRQLLQRLTLLEREMFHRLKFTHSSGQ